MHGTVSSSPLFLFLLNESLSQIFDDEIEKQKWNLHKYKNNVQLMFRKVRPNTRPTKDENETKKNPREIKTNQIKRANKQTS